MRKVLFFTLIFISLAAVAFLLPGSGEALPLGEGSGSAPGSNPGFWFDVGHPNCDENPSRICADWFSYATGTAEYTCCMDPSKVGGDSFAACDDFRGPHDPGDTANHNML